MLFVVFIAAVVIGTAILIVAMYALFGKGPAAARFARIEHLLDEGEWSGAIEQIGTLQQETGLSPTPRRRNTAHGARWVRTLRSVSGKAHQAAGDHLLKDKKFDKALNHGMCSGHAAGNAGGRGSRPGRRRHACRVAPPFCRRFWNQRPLAGV